MFGAENRCSTPEWVGTIAAQPSYAEVTASTNRTVADFKPNGPNGEGFFSVAGRQSTATSVLVQRCINRLTNLLLLEIGDGIDCDGEIANCKEILSTIALPSTNGHYLNSPTAGFLYSAEAIDCLVTLMRSSLRAELGMPEALRPAQKTSRRPRLTYEQAAARAWGIARDFRPDGRGGKVFFALAHTESAEAVESILLPMGRLVNLVLVHAGGRIDCSAEISKCVDSLCRIPKERVMKPPYRRSEDYIYSRHDVEALVARIQRFVRESSSRRSRRER